MAKARHITGEREKGVLAEVVIPNKKGLHARASAQFVRCASSFSANVKVSREGHTVGGTSIMGLMMLAAGQGHSILIEVEGGQAKEALAALVALVKNGFGEED
ncbi:MAG: HPr family phosphocarrier protein [Methyloceanibacter sp.]|uniref:HPr family phosphocarrier protein n=1 Tax=Methyloceanibacter sp. TaxID=1965321 RepID=UPI003D6D6537